MNSFDCFPCQINWRVILSRIGPFSYSSGHKLKSTGAFDLYWILDEKEAFVLWLFMKENEPIPTKLCFGKNTSATAVPPRPQRSNALHTTNSSLPRSWSPSIMSMCSIKKGVSSCWTMTDSCKGPDAADDRSHDKNGRKMECFLGES